MGPAPNPPLFRRDRQGQVSLSNFSSRFVFSCLRGRPNADFEYDTRIKQSAQASGSHFRPGQAELDAEHRDYQLFEGYGAEVCDGPGSLDRFGDE